MTRLHRAAIAALWIGALAVILLVIVGLTNKVNRADHRVQQLAQQVRSLGGKPVVEPATPGSPGVQGEQGEPGPAGPVGPIGPLGPMGITGQPGAKGLTGATGAQGPAGPAGATGAKGEPGKDGADGKNGTNGTDGHDGRGVASITCSGPPLETFTFVYTDGTSDTVACTGGNR